MHRPLPHDRVQTGLRASRCDSDFFVFCFSLARRLHVARWCKHVAPALNPCDAIVGCNVLLTAERRALSCVCAWQGYRLCYEFSAQGLVNVVQELLNGRNGHDLCGWVFVGFGAGRERAESQADEMFNVLCAAMARVLCVSDDRSEAQNIGKDITRRLRRCIGIVSFRSVMPMKGRGEFLEHETYCLSSPSLDDDCPDYVLQAVKAAFKARRQDAMFSELCNSPPSPILPAVDPVGVSDVIELSDDEDQSQKTGIATVPPTSDPTENSMHLAGRGANTRKISVGFGALLEAEIEGRVERTNGIAGGSTVSMGVSCDGGESGGGNKRLDLVEEKLKDLNADLHKPGLPSEGAGLLGRSPCSRRSPPVCLSKVLKKKEEGRTAEARSGDIRSHFSADTSDVGGLSGRTEASTSCKLVAVSLDIVPGLGAEVNNWQLQEPSFFSSLSPSDTVPMACLTPDATPVSLAVLDWDKEAAYTMWTRRLEAFQATHREHRQTWNQWTHQISVQKNLCKGGEVPPAPARQETANTAARGAFCDSSSANNEFSVVISRGVLAAVADQGLSDVAHESLGLLFGQIDKEANEVIITDLKRLQRPIDSLGPDRVELRMESLASQPPKAGVHLVGWFHTHLGAEPFPSSADLAIQEDELQANVDAGVGLICSFFASDKANSLCNRISFSAFRSQGKSSQRVKWSVLETQGLSPELAERCLDGVKEMHAENAQLCQRELDAASSPVKKRWVHAMWQRYLIRLVQGSVPLAIQQLEQSRFNLMLQGAHIKARLSSLRLTSRGGSLSHNHGTQAGSPRKGRIITMSMNYSVDAESSNICVLPSEDGCRSSEDAGPSSQQQAARKGAFAGGVPVLLASGSKDIRVSPEASSGSLLSAERGSGSRTGFRTAEHLDTRGEKQEQRRRQRDERAARSRDKRSSSDDALSRNHAETEAEGGAGRRQSSRCKPNQPSYEEKATSAGSDEDDDVFTPQKPCGSGGVQQKGSSAQQSAQPTRCDSLDAIDDDDKDFQEPKRMKRG